MDVFFYEDRQEELIGELGPEKFGDVFKHDARVVVILYRKEWGESYYTELERAAILDRTARKDQGQSFIMIIGMEQDEVPGWYPSSRIYASPIRFTVQKMAEFIEYKVNERGGEVMPLSFEDKVELSVQKDIERKAHQLYLQSTESIKLAHEELGKLEELVNRKMEYTRDSSLKMLNGMRLFRSKPSQTKQSSSAFLNLSNHTLWFNIAYPRDWNSPGSQSFTLGVTITIDEAREFRIPGYRDYSEAEVVDDLAYKINIVEGYSGWSEVVALSEDEARNRDVFRFLHYPPYVLENFISTEKLVDFWFKELFDLTQDDEL